MLLVFKRQSLLIIIIISIQPEGRFWQEPEPSQATGMALAHCILGSFLRVGYHCFPPPYLSITVCAFSRLIFSFLPYRLMTYLNTISRKSFQYTFIYNKRNLRKAMVIYIVQNRRCHLDSELNFYQVGKFSEFLTTSQLIL